MDTVERELKPTFPQALFCFENVENIPDHYDEWPTVPNFVGKWAIFGWNGGNKTLNYALDIISEEQAILLAEAKKQYFNKTIDIYGYSPDIYILSPEGSQQRYLMGRS